MLLNPCDRAKTAFSTHLGLCEFLRLPFGLKTAPKTFRRILNPVFCEFLCKWLVINIDDFLIWADTQKEALHRYELILKRAVEYGVHCRPTKCCLFATELDALGHHVTQEGRFPTEKGVEVIRIFPRPTAFSTANLNVCLGIGTSAFSKMAQKNMKPAEENLLAM